jgi:hypothetical protein
VAAGRALVALAQPVASAIGTASAASVVASRLDAVMTMRRVRAGRGSGRHLPARARHDVIVPGIGVGASPDEFNQRGQDRTLPPWHPERIAAQAGRPDRGHQPRRRRPAAGQAVADIGRAGRRPRSSPSRSTPISRGRRHHDRRLTGRCCGRPAAAEYAGHGGQVPELADPARRRATDSRCCWRTRPATPGFWPSRMRCSVAWAAATGAKPYR